MNMQRKRNIKEAKVKGIYCPTIQRKAKDKDKRKRLRKQKEAKTKKNMCYEDVSPLSELLVAEDDVKLDIDINIGGMSMQILDISSKRISVEPSQNICNGVSECLDTDTPFDSLANAYDLRRQRRIPIKLAQWNVL